MRNDFPPDEASAPVHTTSKRDRGALWYLVGLFALGGCVGLFAGLSTTPVIGVLLPLLFGLIAGAGGLYLVKEDLAAPASMLRLRFLGQALVAFSAPMLLFSIYGILVRTHSSIRSLLPGAGRAPIASPLAQLAPTDAVELVFLRARLAALGATEDEQVQVLASARAQLGGIAPLDAPFKRLAAMATPTLALIRDSASLRLTAAEDDQARRQLGKFLDGITSQYPYYAHVVASDPLYPPSAVAQRLRDDAESLNELLKSYYGTDGLLSRNDRLRAAILELHTAFLKEAAVATAGVSWRSDGHLTAAINDFLKIGHGGAPTPPDQTKPLRPAFAP